MGINRKEFGFQIVSKLYKSMCEKRKFSNAYSFIDRSDGAEFLLIIIAGYQPFYWNKVFLKVNDAVQQFGEKIDVCVANPGGGGIKELENLCEQYKWSYFYLKFDRLSQAQNQVIKLHPAAKYIFKIDEDIILPKYYFYGMYEAYKDSYISFGRTLGFCAPLININGYGYNVFLDSINVREEFEETFGKQFFTDNFQDAIVHKDSKVAIWLWEHSLPFDRVADYIRKTYHGKRGLCSLRFSVGAVMFDRKFGEDLGYFDVRFIGGMALEEEQMNAYCINNMRSIIIAEDVLVGHLGFYRQKDACKSFFEEHYNDI